MYKEVTLQQDLLKHERKVITAVMWTISLMPYPYMGFVDK